MSDSQADNQNDLLESLLGDFLDESDQLLGQLNERLLQLDEWVRALGDDHGEMCDPNLLNEMFRAAHSLKGLSAMLGLTDINHLTHKIENVFDAARKNELTVNCDVTELVFTGLDQLAALIECLKDPDKGPVDCSGVVDSIRNLLQTAGVERKQTSQADAEKALKAGTGEHAESQLEVCKSGNEPDTAAPPTAEDSADPMCDVRNEEEIPQKYLSIFVDESEAVLDGVTAALLAMESGQKSGDLNDLMAAAHKIKGSAAAIGLNRTAKLAHLMEDILQELVSSKGSASPPVIDVLLRCSDALQRHVAALRRGTGEADQFGPLASELFAIRRRTVAGPAEAPLANCSVGNRELSSLVQRATYVCEVEFEPSLPTAALKASLICEKLNKLGNVSDCEPPLEKLDEIDQLACFRLRLITDQPPDAVKERLNVAGVVKASVQAVGDAGARSTGFSRQGETQSPSENSSSKSDAANETPPKGGTTNNEPPKAGTTSAETAQRPTETIRVDIDRLDHLMDLAGQLVINKAQFGQIGDRFRNVLGCKHAMQALGRVSAELDRMSGQLSLRLDGSHSAAALDVIRNNLRRIQKELEPLRREVETYSQAHEVVDDLFEAIHQLGRVSDGIQQSVMDTRMVPIGPLFTRFKRVVRDITRSTGKQARLEIRGETTELDKRMIDELGDPLVHLVRNSVDHGIEPPDVREAAGKPREGTVTLNAFHRGNSIVIEVCDDGKGLDADRILRKCLEKGLVTESEAEKLTEQQIYQKIWEPGLSTAEKVTEVSGRGMGMDIVKSKIDDLSGTVEIDSTPGQGATITIKLPLTLAILPSLMVEIGGDVFAIPMETVVEIVSVDRNQMNSIQGRQVARVRGRAVSLLRLGAVLSFHDGGGLATETAETTLVIVGTGATEVGLAVDRVIGEQDVVIKSIAENFSNVRGVAGASILGDGRVSLILDIPGLVDIISAKTTCLNR